tara:strand:- start:279 stop:473 length:195 start_codon:yes stop_codon:yes gene_type:complete
MIDSDIDICSEPNPVSVKPYPVEEINVIFLYVLEEVGSPSFARKFDMIYSKMRLLKERVYLFLD